MANNYSKILSIITYLIITFSSLFSQNNYTKEDFAGYWIQTESGFWKNDSEYFMSTLGMSSGVYDGLYFSGDSVEFLNGLDRFDLVYSSKDHDRYKNTDFLWYNRYCEFTIYAGHLNIIRKVFNDTSHLKIIKLNADSLILKRNDYSETFIKKRYAPVNEIQFTKLTIIDDGIGEILRPAYSMEIFDNRTVKLFTDESSQFEKGVYIAKIGKERFDLLLRHFSFLDLNEINNKLYDGETAESTPKTIVIILRDNKKVLVRSNGYYEPNELKWFLRLLYSLYYTLDFTRIN